MAIGYEDVAHAAETLLEDGKKINEITLRRVRAELGTGSMGTISPMLSKWKKARHDRTEKDNAVTLSQELQNIITAEINRLLDKSKSNSSQRIEDLETQFTELLKNYKAMEENHAIAVSELKTVNQLAKSLSEKNKEISVELEKEQFKLKDFQIGSVEARVKYEAAEEESKKLSIKLDNATTEIEKLKKSLAEANQRCAVAEARLEERAAFQK